MNTTKDFFRKYIFHFILWGVFIFSLALDALEMYSVNRQFFFIYLFLKSGVLLILVYSNLLYFYPKYFKSKKYISYAMILLAITLLAGYFNTHLELWARVKRGLIGEWKTIFFLKQLSMAIRYVLTSFLLQITVDFHDQKEKIKRVELEKTISELNFLKAQINPHFLFNTLNNLYALIIEKSEKSGECVLKLAEILKYILANGSEDKVSIKKEMLLLENYIELEKLRKPHADVSFNYKLDNENNQITPLLLLPFVENAFKHGLNTVSKNGFIHVMTEVKDKMLHLSIENNLPPLDNVAAVESHGIGIENVKRRLELLYDKNHILIIERRDNSFIVNLHLQLI